jgi:antiphage defense system Thoeris ThsB-like protein
MGNDNIRNVLISHFHEDDDGLTKLKELLGKNGMTIRDGSINSEKPNNAKSPDYIKSGILAPRISWANTLIT